MFIQINTKNGVFLYKKYGAFMFKLFYCVFIFFCCIVSHISLADNIAISECLSNKLEIIDVSRYRKIQENSVYGDVLSHSRSIPYGDQHGRYTNVHETAHSIHNELRNEYKKLLKNNRLNAIYLLNSQAALVSDPHISIKNIQPYIVLPLRSTRYKLYFEKQLIFWNEYPTYILDEWNCYILGAECAVDDFLQKKPIEKTNILSGALEFSIYSLAMCLTIKDHDPDYWKSNTQFKSLIKYNLMRSNRVLELGRDIPEFHYNEQNRLRAILLKSDEAAPIRHLLKTEFDAILLD
jgi:hypothetical protein